ncbi:glycoside hydrolase family 18 protein [Aspergillus affinis]|uniref:glycoside hydrolase family 18 protein n=1 Tax=Aspergillus affinis TaxID=1070780 RepID=UPI0022FE5819|nr:endochitinase 1 [Aspergillus affinis]KAI9036309.1 endochitinase 1 [Aspergillus affinis]
MNNLSLQISTSIMYTILLVILVGWAHAVIERQGFLSAVYFTNWAIYDRHHYPQDLPVDNLTHVYYAFANIRRNGEVYLNDDWADIQKHFAGDSWDDSGSDATVYGNINQINKLKKKNRNMKVLLSVGGWEDSSNFVGPASTSAGRRVLARSAVELMQNIGFDGIDIDWEYPVNDTQARNMVSLLQELRSELRNGGSAENPYLLTAASPAGPSKYSVLHLAAMDQYLDYWNVMTYDYAGEWDHVSGHAASLYRSSSAPKSTPFHTDQAITAYLNAGIPAHKIILGMPLYGRAFAGTDGPGSPFASIPAGHYERGIYDYKDLPLEGAEVREDLKLGVSWSYDPSQRMMVSFDTPNIIKLKAEYIRSKGLGGGFFWDSSGDKPGEESLISTVACGFFWRFMRLADLT